MKLQMLTFTIENSGNPILDKDYRLAKVTTTLRELEDCYAVVGVHLESDKLHVWAYPKNVQAYDTDMFYRPVK